jgi:hypothetical protein
VDRDYLDHAVTVYREIQEELDNQDRLKEIQLREAWMNDYLSDKKSMQNLEPIEPVQQPIQRRFKIIRGIA